MSKPKVFILGDSHTAALKMGCDLLGIDNVNVVVGGLHWHDGILSRGGRYGLTANWGGTLAKNIQQAAEALGTNDLVDPGVPVIGSFGYHMGQLCQPLVVDRYSVYAGPEHQFDHPGENVLSQAFARDYLEERRRHQIELAEEMARNTSLVMVKQPAAPNNSTRVHRYFDAVISDRLRHAGAVVYDHRDATADRHTGYVPETLLEEDKGHGNAEFGRICVQDMLDRGILIV